ncbi:MULTISPECIES: DUF3997 domain-containing protein [unclassified Clostridium]|uniref:DUF3997 domain-containing protein n=1 Tax=unclassified Clostridium TaxID=2614128 RepID=UPI0025BB847F|nr:MULTISPECIES: DUF3997 domain-containing protein [unclassified Clostridium]
MRKKFIACFNIIMILILFCGCSSNGEFSINLPNNYMVVKIEDNHVEIIPRDGYDENTPIVPSMVSEIAFDDVFILAKQKNIDDIENDNKNIDEDKNEYYWILNTKQLRGYGPFTKEEFESKKEELKIPKDLKLKKVESYK